MPGPTIRSWVAGVDLGAGEGVMAFWKYAGGARVCFYPLNVTFSYSKLLLGASTYYITLRREGGVDNLLYALCKEGGRVVFANVI